MKQKILVVLSVLMLAAGTDAFAQVERHRHHHGPHGDTGFGLTFGYVHSSYRTTDWATDEVETSAGLDGFKLGVTKDFTLVPEALYFQTGLEYMYQNDARNENVDGSDALIRIVGDRTEHYLDLPIRLKYNYPITERIGISIDAGPTLLMGLSSKMKYRTRISDEQTSTVVYNIYKAEMKKSGDSAGGFGLDSWIDESGMLPEGRLRRFDVMLGASVGADFFDMLEVRLWYDWGLINRYKKEIADDLKMRRGQFTLSVGVRF